MSSALSALICLLLLTMTVVAQQPAKSAARMVVIKPKEGMQQQFDEGYKRHLDWHRRNKDKWTWYGWQVVTGDRLGYFMDGTFGHLWEDFDRAVAPAEDAADNAKNVAPYGDFLSNAYYVLLPEVSRTRLLEDGTPSLFIEVLYYQLYPGKELEFERVLSKAHEAHGKTEPPRRYAWYKLISGGHQPLYVLMLPYNKSSELQSAEKSFTNALEEAYPQREAASYVESLRATVREIRSETLRYRADMSYFPSKE